MSEWFPDGGPSHVIMDSRIATYEIDRDVLNASVNPGNHEG
jgi:hypothetical protein